MSNSDNSTGFRNTDWFQDIESIYQSFSLIINDRYKPGSKKEIDNAKIEVENLKRKYNGNKDFEKELSFLEKELKDSMKRKFNGSLFTIIGVIIGILFMFYMSNKVEVESGRLLIDKAESIQQDKITKLKRKADMSRKDMDYNSSTYNLLKEEISELETQEQTNQIQERLNERKKSLAEHNKVIAEWKNTIKEAEEEIQFLSSMSAEEYRDYKIENDQKAADAVSGYGWKTILWFLLYFASTFPFVFTINKNGKKSKDSGWFKVIAVVLGSAQTIRYRRSDGSTYDDNSSYLGAFAVAIALPLAAIATTIVLLPYIATIAFVRNIILPYFI